MSKPKTVIVSGSVKPISTYCLSVGYNESGIVLQLTEGTIPGVNDNICLHSQQSIQITV